jgi:hypothetical protein
MRSLTPIEALKENETMKRSYHVIQETKTGTRVLEHAGKLRPAVLRALQCKAAYVTSGPDDSGQCEEVFRVSGGIYGGIPQAVRIADENESIR